MYVISDDRTIYMSTDDMRLAFEIASRNSFDTPIFVQNIITNVEVMLFGGHVICQSAAPYTVPSEHTKVW